MVVNTIYVIGNWTALVRLWRLASPEPPSDLVHRPRQTPFPPGRPVLLRPGMVGVIAVVAVLALFHSEIIPTNSNAPLVPNLQSFKVGNCIDVNAAHTPTPAQCNAHAFGEITAIVGSLSLCPASTTSDLVITLGSTTDTLDRYWCVQSPVPR